MLFRSVSSERRRASDSTPSSEPNDERRGKIRASPQPTSNTVAAAGRYARIRHPQYVAFVLILLGFLLQWPTVLTLLMFPILLVMYGRLAVKEEAEMRAQFGTAFDSYAKQTPRFFPRF